MDVSAALTQTVEAVSALQKHEKWSVHCVRSTVNMRSAGRIKSVAAAVEQIRGGAAPNEWSCLLSGTLPTFPFSLITFFCDQQIAIRMLVLKSNKLVG